MQCWYCCEWLCDLYCEVLPYHSCYWCYIVNVIWDQELIPRYYSSCCCFCWGNALSKSKAPSFQIRLRWNWMISSTYASIDVVRLLTCHKFNICICIAYIVYVEFLNYNFIDWLSKQSEHKLSTPVNRRATARGGPIADLGTTVHQFPIR